MAGSSTRSSHTACASLLALALWADAALLAQPPVLRAVDGAISVRVPALGLIAGATRARLENGHSVGVVFEMELRREAGGPAVAQARERFELSYDLWEERFAVTRTGASPRSTSHLSAPAAEDWCLRHLTVPRAALAGVARDARVWLRLTYRVEDPQPTRASDAAGTFTLRTLIDWLSRGDDPAAVQTRTFEAGPLRLPD